MTTTREPETTLPTALLVTAALLVPGLCAGAWWIVVSLGPLPVDAARAGLGGAAVVALVSLAGVLVMTPWVTRPVTAWMTCWLAATVLRLLGAPLLTVLLYSATSLDRSTLAIAVGTIYFVTLLSEAGLLAGYLRRHLPSA